MLMDNLDVPNGIANGSICTLKRVVLKPNTTSEMTHLKLNGKNVKCIESKHVDHLLLEMGSKEKNKKKQQQDSGFKPKLYKLQPREMTCTVCNFPVNLGMGQHFKIDQKMQFTQFWCLVNLSLIHI